MAIEQKSTPVIPRVYSEDELIEYSSTFSTPQDSYYLMSLLELPRDLHGVRIVDVGAGGSDLTATLLSRGADAYAVDPLYVDRKKMILDLQRKLRHPQLDRNLKRKYEQALSRFVNSSRTHPDRYIPTRATDLSPLPNGSIDIFISTNCVLGVLDIQQEVLIKAAEVMLRKTKPDGTIQLFPDRGVDFGYPPEVDIRRLESLTTFESWLHGNPEVAGTELRDNQGDFATLIIRKAA